MKDIRNNIESRFIPEPMSGCFLWLGTLNNAGYGVFSIRINGIKKQRRTTSKTKMTDIPSRKWYEQRTPAQHAWLAQHPDYVPCGFPSGRIHFDVSGTLYPDGSFIKSEPGMVVRLVDGPPYAILVGIRSRGPDERRSESVPVCQSEPGDPPGG